MCVDDYRNLGDERWWATDDGGCVDADNSGVMFSRMQWKYVNGDDAVDNGHDDVFFGGYVVDCADGGNTVNGSAH